MTSDDLEHTLNITETPYMNCYLVDRFLKMPYIMLVI